MSALAELALDRPFALLACALAVLPLLPRALPSLAFSHLGFLPRDTLGARIAHSMRWLAALAIAAAGLGLSGPHLAEARLPRSVRGAEVSIVLDRSASMDEVIGSPAEHGGGEVATGTSRSDAVRAALARWVDSRPDDRYAVTVFSTAPIPVLPLTDDLGAVRASLTAAGVGRGLTETQLGRALLRAVQSFEGQPYAGSRVLLLVSDGGAELDDETQAALRAGLQAQRVALYFLFIRGTEHAPDLDALARAADTVELSGVEAEVLALHRFFRSLPTPYRAYQADVPEAIDAAVAEIASQQNLPLTIRQRVPRVEVARPCFAVALACSGLLFLLASTRRRGWT